MQEKTPFPGEVMAGAASFGRFIGEIWRRAFPEQQAPPGWLADFAEWTTSEPADQHRTPAALRRLRRASPRAYDVLFRMLILGDSVSATTDWLNTRATKSGIPLPEGREQHYRPKDTIALFVVGLDYVRAHW